jgi:type I restriction enzyme, S subunit
MEVKPGYKRTEIGPIPEDWAISQLGLCLKTRPSYGINAAAVPYSDQLPAYIRITDISDDGRFYPSPRVSVCSDSSGDYVLADGDIVFARTGASVGKSYRYRPCDGPLVYAGFLIRVTPEPSKLLPAFASAFATTGSYWRWVSLMSMRSGQPGINGKEYAQLPLPIPPLPEQRAIAQALGDVDELIDALDRLIAKKRDIKQATMQQLLTGKTRLPGFSGKWETKTLGEVASVAKGTQLHSSETNVEGDFPHFNGGMSASSYTDKANTPAETIAISEGGNSCGYVQFISEPFWCGGHCYAIVPSKVDKRFLYHALKGDQASIMGLRVGSGLPNVQKSALTAFKIRTPSDSSEQAAIAAVLSDMDAELASLEARRDKTRVLKQGMMQELLTGKTRLI